MEFEFQDKGKGLDRHESGLQCMERDTKSFSPHTPITVELEAIQ